MYMYLLRQALTHTWHLILDSRVFYLVYPLNGLAFPPGREAFNNLDDVTTSTYFTSTPLNDLASLCLHASTHHLAAFAS
jgi:hypothetical protein